MKNKKLVKHKIAHYTPIGAKKPEIRYLCNTSLKVNKNKLAFDCDSITCKNCLKILRAMDKIITDAEKYENNL